jgi:hypothetical protein
MRLILDMPCPLALPLAKSLADFSQSHQAKTKVVCNQRTKHGTVETFHFWYGSNEWPKVWRISASAISQN